MAPLKSTHRSVENCNPPALQPAPMEAINAPEPTVTLFAASWTVGAVPSHPSVTTTVPVPRPCVARFSVHTTVEPTATSESGTDPSGPVEPKRSAMADATAAWAVELVSDNAEDQSLLSNFFKSPACPANFFAVS